MLWKKKTAKWCFSSAHYQWTIFLAQQLHHVSVPYIIGIYSPKTALLDLILALP
jgi:hypothetical protein